MLWRKIQIKRYIKIFPNHGVGEITGWIASHSENPWPDLDVRDLELILLDIHRANLKVNIKADS